MESVEKLSRAILDAINLPLYAVDAGLRIVYVNNAYERLHQDLRFPLENPIGKSLFEVAPFLPEGVVEEFRHVFASGATFVSKQPRQIAGASIVVEVRRFPVHCDGRVACVASTVSDITELENSQMALLSSEETARALMNSSMESMFLMTLDGFVITANETAAKRLGRSVESVVGLHGSALFPPDIWRSRNLPMQEAASSGKVNLVRDSRGGVEFDATIYPIADADGIVRRIAICGRDITEQVAALRALRESEERFRRQFHYNPVPAYVWEQQGDDFVLKDYNQGAESITQGGIASFVGSRASKMYEHAPDVIENLRKCAREQTSNTQEMWYQFRTVPFSKYIKVHYVFSPPNNVIVYTVDLTEQKAASEVLQKSRDDLEKRVVGRTEELAEANEQLHAEREALQQKNIALKELLEQVEQNRRTVAAQLQSNVERVVLPIIEHLADNIDQRGTYYLSLLKKSLLDVVSPFISRLDTQSRRLTPREIEICNLIRNGFSSKEIAIMRNSSVLTVLSQRKMIRRKLGLAEKKVNLTAYLMSLDGSQQIRD
jgi:PAS domain S-box-containing protein